MAGKELFIKFTVHFYFRTVVRLRTFLSMVGSMILFVGCPSLLFYWYFFGLSLPYLD